MVGFCHLLDPVSILTLLTDNVFGPNDDNSRVYDACAKRLVRRVMEGYHGTVFAYGMTGTGKTFSMQGTTSSPGVIPLAINDIFSFIRETPNREFLLRVSYLEIYNERINDLLSAQPTGKNGQPEAPQEEIKLREDAKRGVYATPLKEEIVQSPTQLLRVIARGDMARRVAGTQFNSRSSRSHAVVQVVVESRDRVPGGNPMGGGKTQGGGVRVSTLSLIDLAGSERAAESKERREEGSHINRSLLTLGTVIARLSETKGKDKNANHLPYRDSKLTRLLQPALSGNSLVSILCTISTGAQSATNETVNTLKFAARARNNIVSHAKKAEDGPANGMDAGSKVLLERYRNEIERLRAELEDVAAKKEIEEERRQEEKEKERHEEQMLEMQLARTALKERIEHLNRLILCSKSSGVNSARNSVMVSHPGHMSTISTRSSINMNTLSRTFSTASSSSPILPGSQHLSMTSDGSYPPQNLEFPDDEDSTGGEYADGIATLSAQVRALQIDVADKNRYIATLERRLLHARRSSQSRTSMVFGQTGTLQQLQGSGLIEEASLGNLVRDKDAEIADLRARLDDKERMVSALRSAARNRDVAESTVHRQSLCSACGGLAPGSGRQSRVNSFIAPLPTSSEMGIGLGLGRIRTKSMDDGLSIAASLIRRSDHGSRGNSLHRISSQSLQGAINGGNPHLSLQSNGTSPVIQQTPLPFPPGQNPTRHSHPRLKPFILPWKLATREARESVQSVSAGSISNTPVTTSAPPISVSRSASRSASRQGSRAVSLSSSIRSRSSAASLSLSVYPSPNPLEEDNQTEHSGDEDEGEAVISGRLNPGEEADVNVVRLSMGSRLERHDSNASMRSGVKRREGFLSGFRNGGDGGIGLPPEIGVEELGLGEIVDVR